MKDIFHYQEYEFATVIYKLLTLPLLLLLPLTGCLDSPNPQTVVTPGIQVPAHWNALSAVETAEPGDWLDSFADPRLNELISEGLPENFSLRSAAARIRAAQARAEQTGAQLRPAATLESTATRLRTQTDGGSTSDSFSLTGRVRWELDLWRRLDLTARAATVEAEATLTDYQAARLALAANIARSWFRLGEAGLQLQLSEQTVASYQQSLQVIEEQYRSGLTSALDVRLARSELGAAEASLADRRRLFAVEQRILEQLLGRYPAGKIAAAERLPLLKAEIPAGLPSSLLERRPDVRAAALRLQAAELRSTAARRNRLPDFTLTGSAGTASERLYQLLDWDRLLLSLAASVSQSLFEGGRKSAEQQLAKAQRDEQLNDYAETLLGAFGEVESALAAEADLHRQEQALQVTASEAGEARLLAEQRYRQGLEGIITLLATQRRAFDARSNLLRSKRLRLENRIDLHLALGGSITSSAQLPDGMERP